MVTEAQTLTDTPTDLTAALSLSSGTSYTAQARGGTCNIAEAAAAPDADTDAAHAFSHGSIFTIEQSGDNFYVWGDGVLVVTEAG